MSRSHFTVAQLLVNQALFRSLLVPDGECLRWSGAKDRDGYGKFSSQLVHRLAFQCFCGPIPADITVDHKCYVRDCCNPEHLGLLTRSQNASLQQRSLTGFCGAGHAWTDANTITFFRAGRTQRYCRACNLERVRDYRARQKNRGEQRA